MWPPNNAPPQKSESEFKFFVLFEDAVLELQDYFSKFLYTLYLLVFKKKLLSDTIKSDKLDVLCRPYIFLFTSCCLLYISFGTLLTSQFKIERGEASWIKNIASELQTSIWEALVFAVIPIMIIVITQGRMLGWMFRKQNIENLIQKSFVYASSFGFLILSIPGFALGYYTLNIYDPLSAGSSAGLLVIALVPIVLLYIIVYPAMLIMTLLNTISENSELKVKISKFNISVAITFIIISIASAPFIVNKTLETADQLTINVSEIQLVSDDEIAVSLVLKNNNRTTVVERSKGFEMAIVHGDSFENNLGESIYKIKFDKKIDPDFILLKPKEAIVVRGTINRSNIGRMHELMSTINLGDDLYWPQDEKSLHGQNIDLLVLRGPGYMRNLLRKDVSNYRVPMQR